MRYDPNRRFPVRPILDKYSEPIYCLMRFVVGFLFACHGAQTILGFPPPDPEHAGRELPPLIMIGKWIELVGGVMVATGLLTSVAAFISSGQMAVAYFMEHAKGGFFPIVNGGEPAVIYCFIFLYMAARGSGCYSLDRLLRRRPKSPSAKSVQRWEDEGGAVL